MIKFEDAFYLSFGSEDEMEKAKISFLGQIGNGELRKAVERYATSERFRFQLLTSSEVIEIEEAHLGGNWICKSWTKPIGKAEIIEGEPFPYWGDDLARHIKATVTKPGQGLIIRRSWGVDLDTSTTIIYWPTELELQTLRGFHIKQQLELDRQNAKNLKLYEAKQAQKEVQEKARAVKKAQDEIKRNSPLRVPLMAFLKK